MHGWPAKVAIVGADVNDPLCTIRVTRNQTVRTTADLNTDVDVTVRTAAAPRQMMPTNDQPHGTSIGPESVQD